MGLLYHPSEWTVHSLPAPPGLGHVLSAAAVFSPGSSEAPAAQGTSALVQRRAASPASPLHSSRWKCRIRLRDSNCGLTALLSLQTSESPLLQSRGNISAGQGRGWEPGHSPRLALILSLWLKGACVRWVVYLQIWEV